MNYLSIGLFAFLAIILASYIFYQIKKLQFREKTIIKIQLLEE